MRDLDRCVSTGDAWEIEMMRTCVTHDAIMSDSPRMRYVGGRFVQASLFVLWIATGLGAADVPGQPLAYVTTCVNTLSVLDVTTNELITTIPVGSRPSGVAITPDGSRAYVTNELEATVSVVDIATNAMIETISVGILPRDVAITPDGSRAYIANAGSDTLSVIDTATNQVINIIPGLADPVQVAITPNGSRAYVANQGFSPPAVSVIDTVSNMVIASISIPRGTPRDVAITPDGSRAYVPAGGVGVVWVIETATNTVVASIEGLSLVESVAITPDGTRAYVPQVTADSVAVIDTATNAVVATIGGLSILPQGVEITPDGSRVYVTSRLLSGPVWVIDSVSNSVIATITSIDCATDIAFTPPAISTNKEQCKRGGWRNFGPPAGPFRNQGQCISFVLHNEHR
jgi:YVTN family beta-propeller protein